MNATSTQFSALDAVLFLHTMATPWKSVTPASSPASVPSQRNLSSQTQISVTSPHLWDGRESWAGCVYSDANLVGNIGRIVSGSKRFSYQKS